MTIILNLSLVMLAQKKLLFECHIQLSNYSIDKLLNAQTIIYRLKKIEDEFNINVIPH